MNKGNDKYCSCKIIGWADKMKMFRSKIMHEGVDGSQNMVA